VELVRAWERMAQRASETILAAKRLRAESNCCRRPLLYIVHISTDAYNNHASPH
jgi:hypothetical protein